MTININSIERTEHLYLLYRLVSFVPVSESDESVASES